MSEQVETEVIPTDAGVPAEELTPPVETLAPEGEAQDKALQPDVNAPKPDTNAELEAEHELEFLGKKFNLKGKDLIEALESRSKVSQLEKQLHRDYTQKTQQLAAERKSLEQAFGGRSPEPQELQAMSKLFNAYTSNPQAQQIIDAILSDSPLDAVSNANPNKAQANPEVSALQSHIKRLEGQLSQFMSSSEMREKQTAADQGKRIFDSWAEGKAKSGAKITDDQIDTLLEDAATLRRRNPTWDVNKALDQAYRYLTIDSQEQNATTKVLQRADNAKRTSTIKITPKSTAKAAGAEKYSDIFKSAM